jgi:alkylated DNA nucleotide flippase Atl1
MAKSYRQRAADDHGLPEIRPIPARMQANHGEGTIFVPAPRDVEDEIRRVEPGGVATVGELAERMAARHDTTIGCNVTTGIFARIVAFAADEDERDGATEVTPYWRVVRSGGELNPKYPGGIENLRARLIAEGHTVAPDGDRWRVYAGSSSSPSM